MAAEHTWNEGDHVVAYESPKLVRIGTVEELTKGAVKPGTKADGGGNPLKVSGT